MAAFLRPPAIRCKPTASWTKATGHPGINVRLLAGDCTTATEGDEVVATTDESGAYRFGHHPDTYCVFLDTADEENLAILEEGILTAPSATAWARTASPWRWQKARPWTISTSALTFCSCPSP